VPWFGQPLLFLFTKEGLHICWTHLLDTTHLQVPAQPPPFVDDAFYDALLRSSLEEMASEYVYSVKKAIVDYVIMWVLGLVLNLLVHLFEVGLGLCAQCEEGHCGLHHHVNAWSGAQFTCAFI